MNLNLRECFQHAYKHCLSNREKWGVFHRIYLSIFTFKFLYNVQRMLLKNNTVMGVTRRSCIRTELKLYETNPITQSIFILSSI